MFFFTSLFLLGVSLRGVVAAPSGYFWQITDFHVDPKYLEQDSCSKVLQTLGKYGDFECDPPWELVDSSVNALKQLGGDPDFIVWTGDTPPHPKDYNTMTEDIVIATLQNSTDIIKKYFPDTPVASAIGNHDYYPRNQLPGEANSVYRRLADMWAGWLDDTADGTFRRGAYYTMLLSEVSPKLRVVSINSNLYLKSNEATKDEEDPGGQFAWLREVLRNSVNNQEKVHILLHVPMGTRLNNANVFRQECRDEDIAALNSIIREYSGVILGIYSAHYHLDSFRIIYNNATPAAAVFIAPAVTPWRGTAAQDETRRTPAHNPGVRKYTYNTSTLALLDVEQYYLDLEAANEANSATWTKLYSFREAYGTANVSPEALHELSEDFKETDSDKFLTYFKMNTVDGRPENEMCDCTCKTQHLCVMQEVEYDDFDACLMATTCENTNGAHVIAGSIFLLLVNIVYMMF